MEGGGFVKWIVKLLAQPVAWQIGTRPCSNVYVGSADLLKTLMAQNLRVGVDVTSVTAYRFMRFSHSAPVQTRLRHQMGRVYDPRAGR